MKPRLYLASGSPRRRELLNTHNVPFEVISNAYNDDGYIFPGKNIPAEVEALCRLKATHSKAPTEGYILGVDTIVMLGSQILGKPKNLDEAQKFLTLLSGQTHTVLSGYCLYETQTTKILTGHEVTKVTFKDLSRTEIRAYISHYEVLDKAGGYAIQDIGDKFVLQVEGSLENVIGLPIKSLLPLFKKCGILGKV